MRVCWHGIAGLILLLTGLTGCPHQPRTDLPPSSPFATLLPLPHGTVVGDVDTNSALVWVRTPHAAQVQIRWKEGGMFSKPPHYSALVTTTPEHDFTVTVPVTGLTPDVLYTYDVLTIPLSATPQQDQFTVAGRGQFKTPQAAQTRTHLRFAWSGDLGGQGFCRQAESGYPIFETLSRFSPHFFLFLGDTMYADDKCPSPPNAPGSDFLAITLEDYWAKHRYQKESSSLQRFFAQVPVYAVWDDHEVQNNFSGPFEKQMPIGRQAFVDYWPIAKQSNDPTRLYRTTRWGKDAEFFLLDTRQYRSRNADPDGPKKTMLGEQQLTWLREGLTASNATWKFIVTSVPLSNPKGGTTANPGTDSWSRTTDGTGFGTELQAIMNTILDHHIRNVIWLAGDVHYAQATAYDPNRDSTVDFYEFISGPLSARTQKPMQPSPLLNPTPLYSEGEFPNFGVITVDGETVTLRIVDGTGTVRFGKTFEAQSNR